MKSARAIHPRVPWSLLAAVSAVGCSPGPSEGPLMAPGEPAVVQALASLAAGQAPGALAGRAQAVRVEPAARAWSRRGERFTVEPPGAARMPAPSARVEAGARGARVEAGRHASEGFWLSVDDDAGAGGALAVQVRLSGAGEAAASEHRGLLAYEGALGAGVDVALRPSGAGVEDYVRFASKPASEALRYEVDAGLVAGLRLVEGVLEFLDRGGYPRLRMRAPWALGADGSVLRPEVVVEGCAVDTSPAPPWGRPVVAPGAERCAVEVRWSGAVYPLLVDPAWGSTGGLVVPRFNVQTATLKDGSVLAVGGRLDPRDPQCTKGFCAASEVWKNGVFAASGSLAKERFFHTLTALPDGRALVIGGSANQEFCSQAEVWDQGTFKPGGAMLNPRTNHTASPLPDGRVLVVGGQSNNAVAAAQAEVWNNGTISDAGTLVTPRSFHAATTLADGRVLVAGGNAPGNPNIAQAEVWSAGKFTASGSTPFGLRESTLVGLPDGRALLAGGFGAAGSPCQGAPCNVAYLWEAGAFKSTGVMTSSRAEHLAALLPDGRVLLAGNNTGSVGSVSWVIGNAEVWAPDGSFRATGSPEEPRDANPAMAVLPDGRALIVGGFCGGALCEDSALWDPNASDAGKACLNATQCGAGSCREGVCCDVPCDEPSKSCGAAKTGLAGGVCGPIKNGVACADGSGCGSGFCVDKVCCDAACGGPTQACVEAQTGKPDGTCAPVQNGTPCSAGGQCGSGFCVDSTCCDTACDQPGQRCSDSYTGLPHGVCGVVPAGKPCNFANQCGSGFCVGQVCCETACDQPGYACYEAKTGKPSGQCEPIPDGKPCSIGGQCGSGFCADGRCCDEACDQPGYACYEAKTGKPDGVCAPIPDGTSCAKADDCGSGFCVDNVCCDKLCDGPCEACTAAKKGQGVSGACEPIKEGTDPKQKCPAFGEGKCAAPGHCDGKGACLVHENEECKAGACASGSAAIPASRCNGSGLCVDVSTPVDCGGFRCVGDACLASCSGDGDCVGGLSCSGGVCKKTSPDGATCKAASDCKSGFCVEDVCCESACGDACFSCIGNKTGDTDGHCKPALKGQKDPKGTCAVDEDVCDGDGLCDGAGQCRRFADEGFKCGSLGCEGTFEIAPLCNGAGDCKNKPVKNCAPYACDPVAAACASSCTTSADCAPGASCDAASKQCVTVAVECADAFSVKTPDGQQQSCGGYRCIQGSGCQSTCAKAGDCAPNHECAAPVCKPIAGGQGGKGGSGGSAAQGGSAGQGGAAAGAGGVSSGASGGASAPAPAASDDGGCGCRAVGARGEAGALAGAGASRRRAQGAEALGWLVAAWAARRRARRAAAPPAPRAGERLAARRGAGA